MVNISELCPVLSGVPQGSVLEPLLFLCYINDLPAQVKSSIKLYADDTLVYQIIHSKTDQDKLQEDLCKLASGQLLGRCPLMYKSVYT